MSSFSSSEETIDSIDTTCCIVGCGPAGAMLALLLARKGIPVVLLEAAKDFEREFRGDTLHPPILDLLHQLDLSERLLLLPHSKVASVSFQFEGDSITGADLNGYHIQHPFVTLMPQAQFLQFITQELQQYAHCHCIMQANVRELITKEGTIRGVRYRKDNDWHEVHATLTVGTDGRTSRIRALSHLPLRHQAKPLDLLWFRLEKSAVPSLKTETMARFRRGHYDAVIDRGDYLQVAHFIPTGSYQKTRATGLAAVRDAIAKNLPEIAPLLDQLQDWKHVSFLSVQVGRLKRWYLPGLLLLGDAAHVMSPVGGFGINLAIQDAVVAANTLCEPLRANQVHIRDLATVQRKRAWATRVFQTYQAIAQKSMIAPVLQPGLRFYITRFMLHMPFQRILLTRLIAYGVGSVPVQSQDLDS